MPALAAFVLGLLAGRLRPRWRAATVHLDRWVIHVALPSLIVSEIPRIDLGASILVAPAVAWAVVIVGCLGVLIASRRAGWPPAVTGALLLVVPLGNTSFLGIPAVETLLGDDHVPAAIAYDQLGSFLALSILGGVVVARYGGGRWSWSGLARRLVGFTPFVALVAALCLAAVGDPLGEIRPVLSALGASVGPAALASLGLRLRLSPAGSRGVVVGALVGRMIVLPGAVLAAAAWAGQLSATTWRASVLEAAMPPMVTAGIVASRGDLDGDLAATIIGWGTIVALFTLPVWSLVL